MLPERAKMVKRNLQNDNNEQKNQKPRKSGFFDISDETPEEATLDTEKDEINEKSVPQLTKGRFFDKKRIALASVLLLVLVVGAVSYVLQWIASGDELYGLPSDMTDGESIPYDPVIVLFPDWETDIFTYEKYINTDHERVAYRVWETTYYLYPETYSNGGAGFVFIMNYINAVKRGDSELLNSMFDESYFEKDGNEKYGELPMQKLFNITVQIREDVQLDGDEELEKKYDIYYFVIRYNILENDGYFRNDIDHLFSRPQLLKVMIDAKGNAKIYDVWNIPNYTGDIE